MKAALLTMQNNLSNQTVSKVISALEVNNMKGIFVEKKSDVVDLVKNILFEGATITAGGSVSLKQSGVWDLICSDNYNFLDRSKPGITPQEQQECFKAAIGCDFFLSSTNALTEKGELINVDGFCNRVSSIAFGPNKVIMVVGINKIVSTLEEGFLRIKREAAPKNCVRLGINTPCAKLGHCISLEKSNSPDFTDGCSSEGRICCSYTINSRQRIKDRITVIICGEPLGY